MSDGLLIWWIGSGPAMGVAAPLPPYIWTELNSLGGRAPRGRLWVPRGITFERMPIDDANFPEWAKSLGGVVFLAPDLPLVQMADRGRVTDTRARIVWDSTDGGDREAMAPEPGPEGEAT